MTKKVRKKTKQIGLAFNFFNAFNNFCSHTFESGLILHINIRLLTIDSFLTNIIQLSFSIARNIGTMMKRTHRLLELFF